MAAMVPLGCYRGKATAPMVLSIVNGKVEPTVALFSNGIEVYARDAKRKSTEVTAPPA